jgi:glycosidase
MNAFRALVASLTVLVLSVRAAPPTVTKVEPPNWWIGHSLNPIRVLLHGSDLAGARVEARDGLRAGPVTVNAAGTYAFVDVTVTPRAKAGMRTLSVRTSGGETTAPFEVLPKLAAQGRFQGFGPDDFIYFLMPDRFANGDPENDNPAKAPGLHDRTKPRHYHGGDLRGVIQRLPYLKDLGITAVWLTPWYDNNDRLNDREKYTADNKLDPVKGSPITDYHGYGATDLYGVDEHLGNLATLRELVEAAHTLGLKVIQDQVANHVGPAHPWVKDSPTPTWFNGTEAQHLANTWQTWTLPDPYSPPAHQRQTLEGWFIGILPDLNQNDAECRRYLIQNAAWWAATTGVDGIRQDTLPYVPRTFWRDWSAALHREHPRLTLLGEMFDGDVAKVSFFQGGRARFDGVDSGIDALFDFPLFYRVRETFGEGHSIKPLAEQLGRDQLYVNANNLVTFAGLHDVDRFMNVKGADPAGLKLAFTFLLTTRGIPLLYYGDELALPGGGDPDNRRDFPGGWREDTRNAFTADGRTAMEQEVWQHVRKLGQLRKEFAPLRRGRLVHLAVNDQTYAYARVTATERVLILINNDRTPQTVEVPVEALDLREGLKLTDALAGGSVVVQGGKLRIQLPPRSAAILR